MYTLLPARERAREREGPASPSLMLSLSKHAERHDRARHSSILSDTPSNSLRPSGLWR